MRKDAQLRNCFRTLAFSAVLTATALSQADGPPYLQRLGVYDFDQVWSTWWQQNFGKNHCVPAVYADIFKYLDVNGLPAMSPIPRQTESNYLSAIQNEIGRLGAEMGTDPDSGTNAEDAFDYAVDFTASRAPDILMFHYFFGPDWNWGTATIQDAASSGSICRIGYGRYYRQELLGSTYWFRDGGHAVALVGYDYRNTSNKFLLVNDPNDGGMNMTQSPMAFDFKETTNLTLSTLNYGQVTHARYTMTTGDNNNKRTLVDTMHQIMPVYAAWFEAPVVIRYNAARVVKAAPKSQSKYPSGGTVRVVIPWQPLDQRGVIPNEYRFNPREEMVDWIPGMGSLSAYYATRSGNVYRVNLVSGEHRLLRNLKGAKGLVEGGSTMDLYVLVEGERTDQIVKLERDDDSIKVYDLPGRATALELDPTTGGPAVLDGNLSQVHSLSEDLDRRTTAGIPSVPTGSGEVIFKIDPKSGDILTTRKGAFEFVRAPRMNRSALNVVEMLSRPTTRQALPTLRGITAITPTENGLVMVQDGTTVQTYDQSGVLRKTQLSDLQARGEVKIPHSHFAAKRGQMSGPEWRDINSTTE